MTEHLKDRGGIRSGCITFFIPLSLGGSLELSLIIGTLVVLVTRMTVVWLSWRATSYQLLFEKRRENKE